MPLLCTGRFSRNSIFGRIILGKLSSLFAEDPERVAFDDVYKKRLAVRDAVYRCIRSNGLLLSIRNTMEIVNKYNLLASDKYFTARLPCAPRANRHLDFIAFIEDRALFLGRCVFTQVRYVCRKSLHAEKFIISSRRP